MMRRDDWDQVAFEQDEEGLLRALVQPDDDAAKLRYAVGLSMPVAREAAFQANPACVHCKAIIERVSDAALVITPERMRRVTHRGMCFIATIVEFSNGRITTGARLRAVSPDADDSASQP